MPKHWMFIRTAGISRLLSKWGLTEDAVTLLGPKAAFLIA